MKRVATVIRPESRAHYRAVAAMCQGPHARHRGGSTRGLSQCLTAEAVNRSQKFPARSRIRGAVVTACSRHGQGAGVHISTAIHTGKFDRCNAASRVASRVRPRFPASWCACRLIRRAMSGDSRARARIGASGAAISRIDSRRRGRLVSASRVRSDRGRPPASCAGRG